jgi:hypothetical protein
MMNHLEGRNLAHPGCLIGITTGLILGIILAGVLAVSFNVPFNTVSLIWLAFTLGLGLIGWIIGAFLTTQKQLAAQRAQLAGSKEQETTTESIENKASVDSVEQEVVTEAAVEPTIIEETKSNDLPSA